ncbi:MAG: alpha/beta fold hydrolase [Actinomycetota bacterium]|nr:alpha/beta fold hydrolase [Actinomycetota bacterium]
MASKRPSAAIPEVVRDRVRSLPGRFRTESVNGLIAEWELHIGPQAFAVTVADHECVVREGPGEAPNATITMDPTTWLAIDEGTLHGSDAFTDRKVTVSGNLDLAVRLQTLFRPYSRPWSAADLDQIQVEADGVMLSSYVAGEGTPVVLLHGLGGSKVTWLPIVAPLSKAYRVIVPDLPGHGESAKPRVDYSARFYARVVRHLLDALGIEQAVLLGNSMGGRIALELGLRSPGRVVASVLLSPSAPGLRWRYLMGFTRVFPTEVGGIPFPLRERWMELFLRRLFADPDRLSSDAYSAAASEFIRVYRDPAARMAFFSSLRHVLIESPEPFFQSLRRIKQPTLVLLGSSDRIVPTRVGVRVAEHLPHSRLVIMPNVGHVPQFEATEDTLHEVLAFLETAPSGKPSL